MQCCHTNTVPARFLTSITDRISSVIIVKLWRHFRVKWRIFLLRLWAGWRKWKFLLALRWPSPDKHHTSQGQWNCSPRDMAGISSVGPADGNHGDILYLMYLMSTHWKLCVVAARHTLRPTRWLLYQKCCIRDGWFHKIVIEMTSQCQEMSYSLLSYIQNTTTLSFLFRWKPPGTQFFKGWIEPGSDRFE